MRMFAAAAAALALLGPAAARPQPASTQGRAGPDTYLDLRIGAFFPRSDDVDALDRGVTLSGTFGALFTRHLGVEGTLGYYRGDASVPASTRTPDHHLRLEVVPFLVSLRLVAPLDVAELSARAGGGMHIASLSSGGALGTARSDTAFGYHVGASAAFNLSGAMVLGVDVLRTFVDADLDVAEVDLGGLLATLQLGYRF